MASPRHVALGIEERLKAVADGILDTEVAGPGFINLSLRDEWLTSRLDSSFLSPSGVSPPRVIPRAAAVDFSSPNVAKEMHVGHLRSTIIGDAISRILEFCGHSVSRINHIGDWGTQFGMMIALLKNEGHAIATTACPTSPSSSSSSSSTLSSSSPSQHGSESAPSSEGVSISDLQTLYKRAKAEFDANEGFKSEARSQVVRLQAGEEEAKRIWESICDISRRYYQSIYERLDIEVEERGESFYNPMLAPLVERLEKAGVAVETEGALCVFVEGESFPLIVRKSDGGYTYDTTDLAALEHRARDHDWLVYVTDLGQKKHFDLVWKGGEKAGLIDRSAITLDHAGFGVVQGEDGKKFKSRAGESVKLVGMYVVCTVVVMSSGGVLNCFSLRFFVSLCQATSLFIPRLTFSFFIF